MARRPVSPPLANPCTGCASHTRDVSAIASPSPGVAFASFPRWLSHCPAPFPAGRRLCEYLSPFWCCSVPPRASQSVSRSSRRRRRFATSPLTWRCSTLRHHVSCWARRRGRTWPSGYFRARGVRYERPCRCPGSNPGSRLRHLPVAATESSSTRRSVARSSWPTAPSLGPAGVVVTGSDASVAVDGREHSAGRIMIVGKHRDHARLRGIWTVV